MLENEYSKNNVTELAKLFRNLSIDIRIEILFSLIESEKTVKLLCESLDLEQSRVSHQLKYLKENNLIKSRRDGKNMYYSISDDHVLSIITLGLEHINE